MASLLVHSTPERTAWVRALAENIGLDTVYSHSASLSTKWVPANLISSRFMLQKLG